MRAAPSLQLLGRYLRPQAPRVALLAALLVTALVFQLANPQIIRYFLDATQSNGSAAALAWAAGLYLALALSQQVVGLGSAYLGERLAWTATNRLREDLTRHCLQLDLEFHKTHTPGELIDRIDGDASALGGFFSEMLLRLAANGLLIIGIVALLFREDWRVGAALALYTALTLVGLAVVQPVAIRRWSVTRQAQSELYGYIEERLSGAEDLRTSGAIPYAVNRLLEQLERALVTARAAFLYSTAIYNFTNVLTVGGYAFGLGLGVYLYTRAEATIGTAFLIVAYSGMLATPLQELRQQLREWQPVAASLQRLTDLFNRRSVLVEPAATHSAESAPPPPPGIPAPLPVTFASVSFHYPGDDTVLHDLSFQVEPGRVLGLLGRTGSGKTTLTRLLFRLYDPAHGHIQLNGRDLRHLPAAELRAQIGLVTQDVQLFRATLRENLTFFDAALPDRALRAALDTLGLTDWIERLPDGLDTRLAAGGEGLSAGEAQLLAFARVLLKNPSVVVLDEASSRLDPATEQRLERAVDGLFAGRTGLIVAHRLRTLERADDLLILEAGRIVEQGPRRALAADPRSHFSHLLQTGLETALA